MSKVIPVFRVFDYAKTIEFYIEWLEFKLDWEDKPENAPFYLQVSKDGIVLHLSEHHGEYSPGGLIFVMEFKGLRAYHKNLLGKNILI